MIKKKINIILIIVVLSLWGTVGYRTIKNYFGDNKTITISESQTQNVSLKKVNKDTFQLEKVIRDPFLNKQLEEKTTVKEYVSNPIPIKKTVKTLVPKYNTNIDWPQLQYFGYLKSNDQELILLKIDSRLYKLKLNSEVNGLIVKKKFKDSIEVFFNSQSRIIRLK
ncbi:hypothetical protein B4N84_15690 [Flavobacterium sp. IR1]|nr:hypothetical protein B4N84_15690 [Flavobacterium sp. IR1]